MSDVAEAKRALRAAVRASRSARTESERSAAALGHTEQLIALARERNVRSVATYLSMPDEPSTRGFLDWTRDNNIPALLPIVRTDGLLDWATFTGHETVGAFGLAEPDAEPEPPHALGEVDLILAPAAAVDLRGTRLGWGRGFFDKTLGTLAHCPAVFAVVFSSDVVDAVPWEPHDVAISGAITEHRRFDV